VFAPRITTTRGRRGNLSSCAGNSVKSSLHLQAGASANCSLQEFRHPERRQRRTAFPVAAGRAAVEGPSPFYPRTPAAVRSFFTRGHSRRPFAKKCLLLGRTLFLFQLGPSTAARRSSTGKENFGLAFAQDDGAEREGDLQRFVQSIIDLLAAFLDPAAQSVRFLGSEKTAKPLDQLQTGNRLVALRHRTGFRGRSNRSRHVGRQMFRQALDVQNAGGYV